MDLDDTPSKVNGPMMYFTPFLNNYYLVANIKNYMCLCS